MNSRAPRPRAEANTGDADAGPSSRAIRILIADDHVVIRQGLRQILAEAFPGAEFGEAGDGQTALELVCRSPWHVALLDISMPGKGGLDVLKLLLQAQPNLAVLVLSIQPEDQYALRVLKGGAAGYISKNSASEEVVAAIRKVLAGGKYISAALAGSLAAAMNPPASKALHDSLSDREYQVLRLIALGKSVKEIGYDLSLSIKTVSTYRTRILEKMRLKTNADLIRYVVHEKLLERPPTDRPTL